MENRALIEYGKAQKFITEFTKDDFEQVAVDVYWRVRERAWAAGLAVYYGINGKLIAEYKDGKKMVCEIVNGQIIEKGEYNG